jgi:hypothetical protein
MSWVNHPAYVYVRRSIGSTLRRNARVIKRVRPIIFLCGASESRPRELLRDYLTKYTNCLVFYADDVWARLAAEDGTANALELEQRLASLADAVVIIVESAGTYAELGAFATSDALRAKLLPISDKQHERSNSFLNTGPIRWVSEESRFAPPIWMDSALITDVGDEVVSRLQRIDSPTAGDLRRARFDEGGKHFLILLAVIAETIGPATEREIHFYANLFWSACPIHELRSHLRLAETIGVLRTLRLESGESVFYRAPSDPGIADLIQAQPFALVRARARVLGVMQKIPQAAEAMALTQTELGSAF